MQPLLRSVFKLFKLGRLDPQNGGLVPCKYPFVFLHFVFLIISSLCVSSLTISLYFFNFYFFVFFYISASASWSRVDTAVMGDFDRPKYLFLGLKKKLGFIRGQCYLHYPFFYMAAFLRNYSVFVCDLGND